MNDVKKLNQFIDEVFKKEDFLEPLKRFKALDVNVNEMNLKRIAAYFWAVGYCSAVKDKGKHHGA